MRVEDLLDLLLEDWRRSGRKSIGDLKSKIKVHLQPSFGRLKAAQLASAHVRTFIHEKQRAGYSPASINRLLSCLRRAFTLGSRQDPPMVARVP